MSNDTGDQTLESLISRQLRLGWWALLVFLSLGLVLEALLGFKVGWYMDVSNETRRLVWRLAHAHGTLLSFVYILYALSLRATAGASLTRARLVFRLLLGAIILLPGGFLLGGLTVYDGDPGLGIVLAPVGAIFLMVGVYLVCRR